MVRMTSYWRQDTAESPTFTRCVLRKVPWESWTHLPFTQLRFHCHKKRPGRTFHVITAANNTGGAVVQYFRGQMSTQPDACDSFVRMDDDNATLSTLCRQWGPGKAGKWGSDDDGLHNHPAYVESAYHWVMTSGQSRWDCDDFTNALFTGDFWKVFVR